MEHEEEICPESTEDLRDACGIFGCVAGGEWPTNLDVAQIIYLGMVGLQHRGQESCGMATSFGNKNCVETHKKDGLVGHAFKKEHLIKLRGNLGIGHTRYSTKGGTNPINTQPFVVHTKHGELTLAHNGELINASKLRQEILELGVGLSTESDSELMVQILCFPPSLLEGENGGPNWPARIQNLMKKTQTSYSLLIMNGDKIYAIRDPFGNRPLCLGKVSPPAGSLISEMLSVDSQNVTNGNISERLSVDSQNVTNGNISITKASVPEGYVVSSESCAFPSFGGKFIREVLPGEIVEISRNGFKSIAVMPRPGDKKPAFCIFEYVYFARPDSIFEGQMVYAARKECGRQLARQAHIEADIVSSVPESATAAALGFAEESKIPYAEVLCKNRYVGRTFIQPTRHLRQLAVLKKFGPYIENVKDKRIILVDDSIVRGTTIGVIIDLLRNAGASEVHLRIASPPVKHPCKMGINIPTSEELIANKLNPEELAKKIGADSLIYLKVENLKSAVRKNAYTNGTPIGQCTACLTGEYPVELEW